MKFNIHFRRLVFLEMIFLRRYLKQSCRGVHYDVNNLDTNPVHLILELLVDSVLILISLHSCSQPGVADRKKDLKEQTESSANKRNARKKKNRNVCVVVSEPVQYSLKPLPSC